MVDGDAQRFVIDTPAALSALLFLYGKVLGVELPWFNPVAMVATGNLRYIGMIKLTGVEINESDPLICLDPLPGPAGAPSIRTT